MHGIGMMTGRTRRIALIVLLLLLCLCQTWRLLMRQSSSSQDDIVPFQAPPRRHSIAGLPKYPKENAASATNIAVAADPTLLRRQTLAIKDYFQLITSHAVQHEMLTTTLTADYVCSLPPGRWVEQEAGFKLLSEKIRIAPPPTKGPKLFCAIYSHAGHRELVRMQALTWGRKCDGFVVFSNETFPELNVIKVEHDGPESYQNMWQKVRSIWRWIFVHHLNDYDYFHLGGDDLYLIVENMRRFLLRVEQHKKNPDDPILLGSWARKDQTRYVVGGPGYTLNRQALQQYATKSLDRCGVGAESSAEDRYMSKCLHDIGIEPQETREYETGEPQYHDECPAHLYVFRTHMIHHKTFLRKLHNSFHSSLAQDWEELPHPMFPNQTTGPRHELQAAATYSVSFHYIRTPIYVARLQAILFPETCPATSIMGKALRAMNLMKL